MKTIRLTFSNLKVVPQSRFAVAEAETEDAEVEASQIMWEGILAYEGKDTSDGRYLIKGKQDHRELPLPIMAQTKLDIGHDGAELAARVDEIWRKKSEDEDGVIEIWGRGPFDSGEFPQEVARLVDEKFLTQVSIDYAPTRSVLLDPETHEEVPMDEVDWEGWLMGTVEYIQGFEGTIMGATIVPHAAFEDARIEVVTAGGMMRVVRPETLTASAAGMAPLHPPKSAFERPETDILCPLTITDDGEIFGHLAPWGECHAGFSGVCKMAPHSRSNYQYFHLGEIKTAEGDRVPVGKITVGTKGHASIDMSAEEAIEHYDNTGCVVAFVRATDGKRGIWLSGAIRSDAPAEKVRDLMANPPSGDWRAVNGSLELQGVLSVVIPGFPVPRSEARLVASGASEEIVALISPAYGASPLGTREIRRRRGALSQRLETMGIKKKKKRYSRAEQRARAARGNDAA